MDQSSIGLLLSSAVIANLLGEAAAAIQAIVVGTFAECRLAT